MEATNTGGGRGSCRLMSETAESEAGRKERHRGEAPGLEQAGPEKQIPDTSGSLRDLIFPSVPSYLSSAVKEKLSLSFSLH